MTNWYHEVSPDWLRMRQQFLTASEIMDILPVTATGRKRQQSTINNNILKIWAKKQELELDPSSTGAAARGHIMEPYAILEYNRKKPARLHHWDDVLIYSTRSVPGLAFSPDSLDIPMPVYEEENERLFAINEVDLPVSPNYMGEVKCYSADHHYETVLKNKERCTERWQIAVAMAVCPSLMGAELILYNPNLRCTKLASKYYSRESLKDEIDLVVEATINYTQQAMKYTEKLADYTYDNYLFDEQYIVDEYEKAAR